MVGTVWIGLGTRMAEHFPEIRSKTSGAASPQLIFSGYVKVKKKKATYPAG